MFRLDLIAQGSKYFPSQICAGIGDLSYIKIIQMVLVAPARDVSATPDASSAFMRQITQRM
jgi:hypothetical protein